MMTSNQEKIIRVGSRKSELALIQTKHVIARLHKLFPQRKFEIHTMSTIGDRVLNISLPKIGEKSLFTRDLEETLRNGGVDFVVHSLKDLPTVLPAGMAIGAVLEREDARDALVLREDYKNCTIETLPKGCVIGTSSLRRTAQIRRQYPHLVVCDIRGNLNTRLAKLDAPDSKFAGIILAQAGLVRMGWMNRISQVLEPTDLLYAVGQGALAVECRANDTEILQMLQSLMCLSTTCRILAERSFLKTLGGGCSAPVAVCSKLNGELVSENKDDKLGLSLVGAVWSLDGTTEIRHNMSCSLAMETNTKRTATLDTNGNEDASNEPPFKRERNEADSPKGRNQDSPPVFNDDAVVEGLSSTYDVQELIKKHIDLAKKCPVVGADLHGNHNNENGKTHIVDPGAGGDTILTADQHCPLHIDVGQDFMGKCPFINDETKAALGNGAKCPLTHVSTSNTDEFDHAIPSTSAKCPFSGMSRKEQNTSTNNNNGQSNGGVSTDVSAHGKCPFLQKAVQMFDYADDEKPTPNHVPILIEDVEDLFCGLYQHACHNREYYVRSHKLGQHLAEELIKKGALDVMKGAQAEIHSKA